MIIRFGYVAMSTLLQDASTSRTVTFTNYKRLAESDPDAALNKVRRAARNNLHSCLRLLRYNRVHGIKLYRFSSRLIPLGTHPELKAWDYRGELKKELTEIGELVQENNMRVSFHPDHFTVINTPRQDVLDKSIHDLNHHAALFDTMGLDSRSKLVIHVGGSYRDKKRALERFAENWSRLPVEVQNRITLENDDKIFTGRDVLSLCRRLELPMVLDIHHHRCHHGEGENLAELALPFVDTWENTGLNPKIHVSSPRSETAVLDHHDLVNPEDVYPFLKIMRELGKDLDVMVEAKQKDKAMFKLVEDLQEYNGIKKLGDAVLEYR